MKALVGPDGAGSNVVVIVKGEVMTNRQRVFANVIVRLSAVVLAVNCGSSIGPGAGRTTIGAGAGGTVGTDVASSIDRLGTTGCTGTIPSWNLITDFSDTLPGPAPLLFTFGEKTGLKGVAFPPFAAPGLTPALVTVTAEELTATFTTGVPGAGGTYDGFGLAFNNCVDASAYSGVTFTISGSLGGCTLRFSSQFSEDTAVQDDPKGICDRAKGLCYPPEALVPVTGTPTRVTVKFESMTRGEPSSIVDRTRITAVQWQLKVPVTGCTANLNLDDVSFTSEREPPTGPATERSTASSSGSPSATSPIPMPAPVAPWPLLVSLPQVAEGNSNG